MTVFLITLSILILSILCLFVMIFKLIRQPSEPLSLFQYLKLGVWGIIAFIADTLGIGSFAIHVALAKITGTFSDDELPAVSNGAQILPGMIEALFFIHLIEVDLTTLLTLVVAACIGGLLGGFVVNYLSKQMIRLGMICCFILIILLLISHQFRLLPLSGDLIEFDSWRLAIGFWAMIICGALTSFGVGLFVMVQGVLFLMNVSAIIAFPIMMIAGAMQQPLTTLLFLKRDKIPLKKTMVLSLFGCIGVLITIPIFMHLTINWLHSLLLFIMIYNVLALGFSYLRLRQPPIPSVSLVAAE